MTDEARGYNSEDAPVRPASTRWSDDAAQDDAVQDEDGLAPPYVPGRRTPTADSTSPTSTSATSTSAASTSTSTAPSDDDFPFDQFDIDGDADADAAAPEGRVGEEAPAVDQPYVTEDFDSEADEMVWSPAEDLGDEAEPYEQAEQMYTEDPDGEWSPGYEDVEDDDAFAVDAELEPIAEEPPVEDVDDAELEAAEDEPEHRFEPDGTIETEPTSESMSEPAAGRAEEVARVLDRLAGLLRDEGEEAVRREMDSQDRLTALVSSLLIGHLSARQ